MKIKLVDKRNFIKYSFIKYVSKSNEPYSSITTRQLDEVTKIPTDIMKSVDFQRTFLSDLLQHLNYNSQTLHKKKIPIRKIIQFGGRNILYYYNSNLHRALTTIFPDIKWEFKGNKPKKYWEDVNNQRNLFEEIFQKLGLKVVEDWENVQLKEISHTKGLRSVLNYYNRDFYRALETIYPSHSFSFQIKEEISNGIDIQLDHKYKQKKKPNGYWQMTQNQKKIIYQVKDYFKIKEIEDLFYLNRKEIDQAGGNSLFALYPSWKSALVSLFPEIDWNFIKLSKEKQFIKFVIRFYMIEKKSDWYRLSFLQIRSLLRFYQSSPSLDFSDYYLFCNSIDTNNNSANEINDLKNSKNNIIKINYPNDYFKLRSNIYPEEDWELVSKKSATNKKSNQRWLYISLKQIYPQYYIIEDYFHPLFSSVNSLQFDVFIPSLNCGFEYQGEQHYEDMPIRFPYFEYYQSNDQLKEAKGKELKIQLFFIPYWWNLSISSLSSVISQYSFYRIFV